MKPYNDCIREDGDCTVCSLSSYGRDCRNRNISGLAWMRRSVGLSQPGLAKKLGVPVRWVQKLESGDTKPDNITLVKAIALADALGVDVRGLIQGEALNTTKED